MSKTKSEQLASERATRAKKKAMAKARGLCITCVKVQPQEGELNCDGCRAGFRADAARRASKARADGSCIRCKKRPACLPCPMCPPCSDIVRTYNRERMRRLKSTKITASAQKTCKPKEPSGIINESVVNHENGDTNGQVHKEARSKSSQSQARQVRCKGKGRAEGQSQGQLGHGPNVLGLHTERPQRPNLPEALATVSVFGITFGLLIAGMLR